MVEFVTDALVVGKRISGERDSLAFLFTEAYGIIPTLVAAGTAITSKLTPYLNTLSFITARIVGKNHYRLAGALEASSCHSWFDPESGKPSDILDSRFRGNDQGDLLKAAYLVKALLPPFVPEPELWRLLRDIVVGTNVPSSNVLVRALELIGYDPRFAQCSVCGAKATRFAVQDATFYCNSHGTSRGTDTFDLAGFHQDSRWA